METFIERIVTNLASGREHTALTNAEEFVWVLSREMDLANVPMTQRKAVMQRMMAEIANWQRLVKESGDVA